MTATYNHAEILAKLTEIDRKVGQLTITLHAMSAMPTRPPSPPLDYTKIHNINTAGLSFKGTPDGKVTIVEYTDYQ